MEECPRLVLAPFSRPPQVVFENVVIGSTCERTLEVFNPSKKPQQIRLNRSLPAGLIVELPGEWFVVEPETCYCLNLIWTPRQPTALRDTIRFSNENRGRYDVIVVFKTGLAVKSQTTKPKESKISAGKIKKKVQKKSPVAAYKKKAEIIYNTTKIKQTVNILKTTDHRILQPSNKHNILTVNDDTLNSQFNKCPFDSQSSVDFNFDTSEIFSYARKMKSEKFSQRTYEEPYANVTVEKELKPNEQLYISGSELFDNLTFTPLKSDVTKHEKLDKGPKIIISTNSESDFEDSLTMKNSNKENETHSIISITSMQPPNKWFSNNYNQKDYILETPVEQTKKIPNTSSPTDFNSPNFSINTELSRISDLSFFPQRFSTDRKGLLKMNNETQDIADDTNFLQLGSDTFTKESPNHIVNFQMYTVEPKPPNFFMREQPKMCRQALFKENQVRDVNCKTVLPDIETYTTNGTKYDVKSPTRSTSPTPLQSIPEESMQISETQLLDKTEEQMATFTINRTIDRDYPERPSISSSKRLTWSKKAFRAEPDLWKIPTPISKKPQKPKINNKTNTMLSSELKNKTFEANESINKNLSTVNHIGNVYSQSSTMDPFLSSTYFYDEEAVEKFETEFKSWLNCILTPPSDLDSNIEQKIDVGKAWLENRNREVPLAPTKEQVCSVYHNSHRLKNLRRSARILFMSPEITLVFQKLNAQIEKKLIAIRSDRNLHLDIGLQKIIMELLLSYNPLWLRIGLEAIYGTVLPLKSNSDIEGLTTFIIQRMFKNPYLKSKNSKSSVPNMLLPAYLEGIKKFTLKKFFMLVFFLDQAKQKKLISHDPCLFCRNAFCKESREVIIRFTRELIAGIGDITKHLRPLGYIVSHKQSYLDEYKYAVHNIAIDLRDGVRLTKVMEIILMKNGLLHQLRTPAISRLQKIHNVAVALSALKEANFTIAGDITSYDIADGHREKTLSLLWQLIHVFRAPLFEKAANVIQLWWKKKYQVIVEKRKEAQRVLETLHKSATVVQRWWRHIHYRRLVKRQMHQVTYATLVIQKYCRMWLCRNKYCRMKTSVKKIEQWYTSMKLIKDAKSILYSLKREREELREKSAIIVQSSIRRWLCRKRFTVIVKKIIIVQSVIRTYLIRKEFLLLRRYTISIQQRYRSKLLMKAAVKSYEEKKKAAITVQRYYRNAIVTRLVRNEFLHLKNVVIKIQRKYRSKKLANELRRQKAATKIQVWYKSIKQRNLQRLKFLKIRTCSITIQSMFRMYKARSEYLRIRHATVIVQRAYKQFIHTRHMNRSAAKIQIWYRSIRLRRVYQSKYLKLKTCAVKIQSLFRMYKTRLEYLRLRRAAITIQRAYRKFAHEVHMNKAASKIQIWYKSIMLRNIYRLRFLKVKSCTVLIQSVFRMYKAQSEYLRLRNATITIQRAYRKHRANRAAAKIQVWYRAIMLRNIYRRNYLSMKTCAIVIQSAFRMFKKRSEYFRLKRAAITIQRAYRNHRRNKAASKIQLWYKSIVLRNIVRRQYLKIITCTVIIQSRFRMIKARSEYLRLRSAIVRIQRAYRLRKWNREQNLKMIAIIKLQAHIRCHIERTKFLRIRRAALVIQAAFRLKQRREFTKAKREAAAVCIQKNVRRYLCRSSYLKYRKCVITVQRLWKGKLLTRLLKFDFMHRKNMIIKVQAIARGYLARKRALLKRNSLLQIKEEKRLNWAASKIQALFRGHHIRKKASNDMRLTELRRRWRDGALISYQQTLKERNEEAMDVLRNMSDIETVIRAFRSLELVTEVKPMMYDSNAASIVRRVYVYMSVTNRSISSIEVLKSAASILVNLTRYRITGPNIYARERIPPILKFMLRFSNSETHLFCILCTYVWLFSKYNDVKQDLKEFLHLAENHKVLTTIRGNVERMKRMSTNASRSKFNTPQLHKFVSHTSNQLVNQGNHDKIIVLPSLEPDYGLIKAEKPRYFEDPHQAIKCLFRTYDL